MVTRKFKNKIILAPRLHPEIGFFVLKWAKLLIQQRHLLKPPNAQGIASMINEISCDIQSCLREEALPRLAEVEEAIHYRSTHTKI